MHQNDSLHEHHRKFALLFTGHMIDAPDRVAPRFPAALESRVRAVIGARVAWFSEKSAGSCVGIASGACGGDILFHEACAALGLPSILVLPFGPDAFVARSVRADAAGEWEVRFAMLWNRLGANQRIVLDVADVADPFGACNSEMLAMARRLGETVELLALWDGEDSGKPGGTGAFAHEVRRTGGGVTVLNTKALLAELAGAGS
jgi:hypothetical protein